MIGALSGLRNIGIVDSFYKTELARQIGMVAIIGTFCSFIILSLNILTTFTEEKVDLSTSFIKDKRLRNLAKGIIFILLGLIIYAIVYF